MTAVIIHIDLDALDQRLDHGRLWTTGWGNWTDTNAPTCLHGAIRACQPVPGDASLIKQVGERFGFGIEDNDVALSWERIRTKVIPDITDEMLATTFGPQWEHIVVLMRRAAMLTPAEGQKFNEVWKTIRIIHRFAAIEAAWDASQKAALKAARKFAWKAAWNAAQDVVQDFGWDAVRKAAVALAVRDLIGQHGFEQHHYDILTYSWATVIGNVHPDDEENT
jgi:hypothetical protein